MDNTVPTRHRPDVEDGFIGKRIRFVFVLLFWIIGTLFINIIIECIGIAFSWWDQPGSLHANTMLVTELSWLNKDFHSVLGSPLDSSVRFSRMGYDFLFVYFGKDLFQTLVNADALKSITVYLNASVIIFQLFIVRLVVVTFSLPVFLIFSSIALVDGLVVRVLRRLGADRESGYVWHHAAASIKPLVIIPFIIYLASPWSLHPSWVLLPFVLMQSMAIWLTSSKFKKYM